MFITVRRRNLLCCLIQRLCHESGFSAAIVHHIKFRDKVTVRFNNALFVFTCCPDVFFNKPLPIQKTLILRQTEQTDPTVNENRLNDHSPALIRL